jgi:hypothetical protein
MDLTIGRKGFLTYLKSLGGSNVVKVVPSNGDASGLRVADMTETRFSECIFNNTTWEGGSIRNQ